MLKNIRNRFRKKLELKLSPGEQVRDEIIKAGIKVAQESGYKAGNATEKLVGIADKIGHSVDLGTQLGGGGESASALGRIAFKATKDAARNDSVCTGLCLVSAGCETIALGCTTIKIIPYRGQIYVCAKIISKGCMSYRNLCAGDDC